MRQHGGKCGNSRQVLLWVKAGGHKQCCGQHPRTHELLSGPTCDFQDHSRSCHRHTSPDGSSQPGSHVRVPCVMLASVQLAMICLNWSWIATRSDSTAHLLRSLWTPCLSMSQFCISMSEHKLWSIAALLRKTHLQTKIFGSPKLLLRVICYIGALHRTSGL